MILTNTIQTIKGHFNVEYHDADSFDQLPLEQCRQAYGICYYHDLIVLCWAHNHWILPGGTVEMGETLDQTLAREVQEESNMKVLIAKPIGYQKCWNDMEPPFFQVRFYAKVEPFGPFETDPAGQITKIELVEAAQAPALLNWGDIGNRLFERAAELHHDSQVA